MASDAQILNNALWIVLAPFIAGTLIILGARKSKTASMMISVGAVLYGFIHSLLIFQALAANANLHLQPKEIAYFTCPEFKLSVGILIDHLTSVMLIVVTGVSLLVQIYTHGYMREDPGYSRFYSYLSLFTGSMLGLVVSTNLFQMYGFWELVGVCSYFLIGFWWYKNSAAEACLKAFVVNRVGDCGFLIGILLLFGATRDLWHGETVLAFTGTTGPNIATCVQQALASHALQYWGWTGLFAISVCIFLGPVAKSAQFPLHVWLPDAMEGPTPISALIHAATMVAAGVYLVARAYPIWQIVPEGISGNPGMAVIAITGAFTSFMAATIAMSQFDIKRVLAWSTVSQLGYMFVGLGVGAFTGGIFHLFNHAFFKAMLFLGSGAVIHGLHGEQDIRYMGGLKKHMPATAATFLIGTLSISGCPPLSGFFSKDDIIASAWAYNNILGFVMILTAGLTAFYMFRVYMLTFEGEYRGTAHPHNSGAAMTFPLIVLAVPSIASGWLGVNFGHIGEWFAGTVGNPYASFVYFNHPHVEPVNTAVMGMSLGFALGGAAIAYMTYITKSITWNTAIVDSKSGLYNLSLNKWYWDDIYLGMVRNLLDFFRWIWKLLDDHIVDTIVDLSAFITDAFGQVLKLTQTGRGQSYALVIFGCVAVLTLAAFVLRP